MKFRTLIILAVAAVCLLGDTAANAYVVVRHGYWYHGYHYPGTYYRGYYARPYPGAVWVPRHWIWRNGYRVWVAGHWR